METKQAIRLLVETYSRKIKRGLLAHIVDPAADIATNALKLTKEAFSSPRKFYLTREDRFPTHSFDRKVMKLNELVEMIKAGDVAAVSAYLEQTLTPQTVLFAFSEDWHADPALVHDRLEDISNAFITLSHMNLPVLANFADAVAEALKHTTDSYTVFGEEWSKERWISRFCGIVLAALPALSTQQVLTALKPHWASPHLQDWVGRFPPAVLTRAVLELQNLFAIQIHTVNSNTPDTPLVLTASVISYLYKANTRVNSRGIIDYKEFYNATAISLEQDDIIRDFETSLRNQSRPPQSQFFCFSRFPCLVDTKFKALLMQFDGIMQARTAMQHAAIGALFSGGQQDPFFNMVVRRDRLIQSTLNELERKSSQVRKPLKVTFHGEPGIDAGGLKKEFFQILMKELLDPNFGMFFANENRMLWFQPSVKCQVSKVEFRLVGTLMGLAVFNNVILDVPFPHALYRKLLGLPMDFEDLKEVDPALASGLEELLRFEESEGLTVEDVFCREFVHEYEVFDERREVELCPGGKERALTGQNRAEYVRLVTELVLNLSIADQFEAFRDGFSSIADRELMKTMHPSELELLVCGQQSFDFADLQSSTRYEGFQETDDTIKYFWEVLRSLSVDDQKLFLRFATGSDRVPVGGLKDLNFVIGKNGDDESMLPTSHTCFNHLLLPSYTSLDTLRTKLLLAIQNCQGFGLR